MNIALYCIAAWEAFGVLFRIARARSRQEALAAVGAVIAVSAIVTVLVLAALRLS